MDGLTFRGTSAMQAFKYPRLLLDCPQLFSARPIRIPLRTASRFRSNRPYRLGIPLHLSVWN